MSSQHDPPWQRLDPSHINISPWLPMTTKSQPLLVSMTGMQVQDQRPSPSGQRLISTQAMSPGQVILQEQAMCSLLRHAHNHDHCSQCLAPLDPREEPVTCRRQNQCQWPVRFCSLACEDRFWIMGHRWLCRFPEWARFDERVLLTLQAFTMAGGTRSPPVHGIANVVANLDNHSPDTLQSYRTAIDPIQKAWRLSPKACDALVVIQAQIRCNGFAIQVSAPTPLDSHGAVDRYDVPSTLALGLFQHASRFNHACQPQAVAMFDAQNPRLLCVRLTEAVDANQPIHISYGPLVGKHSRPTRLSTLANHYFFTCQCDACTDTSLDALDRIYRCPRSCSRGFLYYQEPACPSCHTKGNWDNIDQTQSMIDELVSEGRLEKALLLQQQLYHPKALPIGRTLDRMAHIWASQGHFSRSADVGRRSLAVVQHIYGSTSMETAEEMAKLATILFHARDPDTIPHARKTLALYRTLGLDIQRPDDVADLQHILS